MLGAFACRRCSSYTSGHEFFDPYHGINKNDESTFALFSRRPLSFYRLGLLSSPLSHAEFSRAFLDDQLLLLAPVNGIEIAYRTVGFGDRATVIMIMGLGFPYCLGRHSGQGRGAGWLQSAVAG
jgi:hypothetical protein